VRIDIREVDAQRLFGAATRRLSDIPERMSWMFSSTARDARRRIARYRNRHAGERCVIIANGPSLLRTDMALLRNEHTFCMNRAYLMFDTWGFIPSYFTCLNPLVISQFAADISNLPMPKFLNFEQRALFSPDDDTHFFRVPPRLVERFQSDLTKPISSGGTVTYATLQIAFFMGFREVVLVGLDHSFVEKGTPGKTEVRESKVDESHMHPNYFPQGIKWQLPDLVRSEHAYAIARDAFARHGGRIIDATVGGHCTVFEKKPLELALSS
jgi:hypothetical protein